MIAAPGLELLPWQWALGAVGAALIGFSKTGLPGSGILVVPLMALVFGGRLSVGATLPMLIAADLFAVRFYHAHADWGIVRRLMPSVVVGIGAGTWFLYDLGVRHASASALNPVIGGIVLAMLAVSLLRGKWGERLAPTSPIGVQTTGFLAGFTTMVSNAAGPVMQIYFVATRLPKERLMGTTAVYFLLINCLKLAPLFAVNALVPSEPLITGGTLLFGAAMLPAIALGAFGGRRLLPHIPQKAFTTLVMVLSALAAVKLLLG